MTVQLSRIPLALGEGTTRSERLRAWVQQLVHESILCNGRAKAQVLIPYEAHADRLDLDAAIKDQPQADHGATFRHLASLAPGPAYLVVSYVLPGQDRATALVVEEQAAPDGQGRQWWAATLSFDVDLNTGVGRPAEAWSAATAPTSEVEALPAVAQVFVNPIAGGRPAQVEPPGLTSADIRMAFGELDASVEPPADAVGMVMLTRALCLRPLLDRELAGTVVVKRVGRSWEAYQLRGPMPGDTATMIRYLANAQEPVAEGIAMIAIVVYPERGPDPGVQIIAQQDGQISEAWLPLSFPKGRAGSPVPAGDMMLRAPRPVAEPDRWLGVVPDVDWDLPMLGVGEA